MPVTQRVKRIVWVRDGGCCVMCRERVFLEGREDHPAQFIGEVAHIVAERRDGPRGDSELTLQQRNHENNLLLLCFDHHHVIDTNVDAYPVAALLTLKLQHAAWLSERLKLESTWTTKLHNFYYLNIPRLLVLSAYAGKDIDLSRYGHIVALHELGWELNSLMMGFKDLLSQVELKALSLDQAIALGPEARGTLVSFNQQFRTKNINMPESPEGYMKAIRGDPAKDPQIYAMVGGQKITLIVDPRWITTTTAFVQFRPPGGRGDFAGVGLINAVLDHGLSVTPLVIGLPSNPFLAALYDDA